MKKIIFSVILVIAFLIIFISCVNENNPSNLNIGKENPLDSDKKEITDNSNNSNEKDLDKVTEDNLDNTTEDPTKDIFLSNIPYDKNIKYTSSINGNLANRSDVTDDEDYIYYINVKDENKLYKINKNGNDNQLVYGDKIEKPQYFNEKLYFLRHEEIDKDASGFPIYNTYICSVDKEGDNYTEITSDSKMDKFLVLDDKIYYIAYSGPANDELIYGKYDLFCYDIVFKKKNTIYENIDISEGVHFNSSLLLNDGNIYFDVYGEGIIEYNIKTGSTKNILSRDSDYYTTVAIFIVIDNKLIFECKNDKKPNNKWEVYIKDIKDDNDKLLCIFSEIKHTDMLMSININNNYVFLTYTPFDEIEEEKSKVVFIRMKHNGSEAVKIKEIFRGKISHLSRGEIYLVDDKLIFLDRWEDVINNRIKVMDFDGNEMDWDI